MKNLLYFIIPVLITISCNDFLDEIPDRSLAVPTSVVEFEQLMNFQQHYAVSPSIQEFGIDDFFLPHSAWNGSSIRIRNSYVWNSDIYEGSNSQGTLQDWNGPYSKIYVCNVVLDGLIALKNVTDKPLWRKVFGQALFLRAFYHYQLQETYGQPYKPDTRNADLGIPLRLTSLLQDAPRRSTVDETYRSIVSDLKEALEMVDKEQPDTDKIWISKAAIYAMLSRVHLTMQDYGAALSYADESLKRFDVLLNFNNLPLDNSFSFPDHDEMLFRASQGNSTGLFMRADTFVDTTLYDLYDTTDLRKTYYFKAVPDTKYANFRNLYSGGSNPFSGLGVDEMYLTRAECRARLGNPTGALEDLNHLLVNRYQQDLFTPIKTEDHAETLAIILNERRKELILRGTRWTDLRRLNQDPKTATVLVRALDSEGGRRLEPGDARYTYPIPSIEIDFNNFPQNER